MHKAHEQHQHSHSCNVGHIPAMMSRLFSNTKVWSSDQIKGEVIDDDVKSWRSRDGIVISRHSKDTPDYVYIYRIYILENMQVNILHMSVSMNACACQRVWRYSHPPNIKHPLNESKWHANMCKYLIKSWFRGVWFNVEKMGCLRW